MRPASKPSEPQTSPPQKLKVSCEAAAGPAVSGNIPAVEHAVLFSVFCQTEIKQLTVRLFQTCVSVFI